MSAAAGQLPVLQGAGAGNGPARGFLLDTPWTYYAYGTFDGATVTIEVSPDGGTTWFDTGESITEKGVKTLEIYATDVRGVVTGGTSPAVDLDIVRAAE